jgi:hypothetical protein
VLKYSALGPPSSWKRGKKWSSHFGHNFLSLSCLVLTSAMFGMAKSSPNTWTFGVSRTCLISSRHAYKLWDKARSYKKTFWKFGLGLPLLSHPSPANKTVLIDCAHLRYELSHCVFRSRCPLCFFKRYLDEKALFLCGNSKF